MFASELLDFESLVPNATHPPLPRSGSTETLCVGSAGGAPYTSVRVCACVLAAAAAAAYWLETDSTSDSLAASVCPYLARVRFQAVG